MEQLASAVDHLWVVLIGATLTGQLHNVAHLDTSVEEALGTIDECLAGEVLDVEALALLVALVEGCDDTLQAILCLTNLCSEELSYGSVDDGTSLSD